MKKLLILVLALTAALPAFAPTNAKAVGISVEVGDRPYYRGPAYWGPRHEHYYWVPGHWVWRRHRQFWIHGHYVVR